MANEQYIRCPDCGSQIPFSPYALIRGERFGCPNCPEVSIGLEPASRDVVKSTLDQFETMKKNLGSTSPNKSSSLL